MKVEGDHDRIDRFGAKLYVLWAGLSLGVAFLATPAKFLAPSLTLPVALEVGQHTFGVYNHAELALLGIILVMDNWSGRRARWYLSALLPMVVVLAQALWLIPALDLRVAAIQAGQGPLPPSNLHAVYVGAEIAKLIWLLYVGLVPSPASASGTLPRRRPRPFRSLQE